MKPRLLIAESDSSLRNVYERLFSNLGYSVETAADGLECLEKMWRSAPDVLVIDWQMPWGGGDGVLEYICCAQDQLRLNIVLVTCESPSKLAQHLKPPVIACLEKPFRISVLLDAIHGTHSDAVLPADLHAGAGLSE